MLRFGRYQFLITGLLVLALGIGVFLFLKGLFASAGSPYGQEITAAVLGTVMITIVTMSLLAYQSRSEEKKEKSLGIFTRKVDVYSGFLDFVTDMIRDGKVDSAEIAELTKWTTRIALLAGEEANDVLRLFVGQCNVFRKFRYEDLTESEIQQWKKWYQEKDGESPTDPDEFVSVALLVGSLRNDLGEANVADVKQVLAGMDVIDDLVKSLCAGRK
jgi:hypothetical protein